MWFPLLFVSNTLICRQVSVYASPPELVKQTYMSMTTSPVLWARKDLNLRLPRYQRGTLNHLSYLPIKIVFLWTRRESNPPRSPCKGVPPALEHASPKYSSKIWQIQRTLCLRGNRTNPYLTLTHIHCLELYTFTWSQTHLYGAATVTNILW